jgi:hypothetical protein
LPKNELLDIFYNGLTIESETYLDSCAGGVFRKKTLVEAEELMAKISRNYNDWTIAESMQHQHQCQRRQQRREGLSLNLSMFRVHECGWNPAGLPNSNF